MVTLHLNRELLLQLVTPSNKNPKKDSTSNTGIHFIIHEDYYRIFSGNKVITGFSDDYYVDELTDDIEGSKIISLSKQYVYEILCAIKDDYINFGLFLYSKRSSVVFWGENMYGLICPIVSKSSCWETHISNSAFEIMIDNLRRK